MHIETLFPLVISHTDMGLLSQCELRWFRSRCQNLTKSGINIDLLAGSAFAAGMQEVRNAYYLEGVSPHLAINRGALVIDESFSKASEENMGIDFSDELKSPANMQQALRTYFIKFPLQSEEMVPLELEDGTKSVEYSLTAELPIKHPELDSNLFFKGKLDLLAKDSLGFYIVDEKTTKRIDSNTGTMLGNAGQFLGYVWLLKNILGIEVKEVKIRKIAIYKSKIEPVEFSVNFTSWQVENWYKSLLARLRTLTDHYGEFIYYMSREEEKYFLPDFENGCTSYNRSCQFMAMCQNQSIKEKYLDMESGISPFKQQVWNPLERKQVSLVEYKKELGLL